MVQYMAKFHPKIIQQARIQQTSLIRDKTKVLQIGCFFFKLTTQIQDVQI